MLPEALGHRGLVALGQGSRGLRSSRASRYRSGASWGDAARGLGPSRARCHRLRAYVAIWGMEKHM